MIYITINIIQIVAFKLQIHCYSDVGLKKHDDSDTDLEVPCEAGGRSKTQVLCTMNCFIEWWWQVCSRAPIERVLQISNNTQ